MPTAAITLTTPLPPADLRFDTMTYSSGLSQLEEIQLQMLSERPDLQPEDLLGHLVDVKIELRDGEKRHVGGYVSRFGMGRHQGRYYGYHATVVPWLWFLTRKSDCRIFQDLDVKEIVTKIFEGHAAIANYEWKLTRMYRKRSYCVQYRETDFNFIARLLEDEGIYWYFEHTDGAPRLILVDMASAHAPVPGYEALPYYGNVGQASPDADIVTAWNFSREVRSGKVALTSYNFEQPGTDLKVAYTLQRSYALSEYELFDFQGDYVKSSDGEQLADNRMDEVQARFEQLSGTSNAYGLASGHLFSLTRHPREDQNGEYLLTQVRLTAELASDESGRPDTLITCDFSAIPSDQQFRPPRRTPKPFVQGPQSAVVTGPSGHEIHTDPHGRVKVRFFWDRHGKKDDTSSCWLRVSHPWAGKGFGMVHIPRVGQEVIVDFLEGDPDQPLVTGRVYNADQTPPWDLPANATQSGIHTRSTKGGAYNNANTLRFEDKKGAEQVMLHAERNLDVSVEWDHSHTVVHDQTNIVQHHQKTNIWKGRELYVEAEGETYYVKGERKVYIDGPQTQTVTKGYNTFVTQDRNDFTQGARTVWTKGTYTYKSIGATFMDCGPLMLVNAGDIKMKATSGLFGVDAAGAFHAKAASFRFTSLGDIDFTGNNFNRVIFQGNDTVLGPNTNTYIGVSRDVAVGPATEVYVGMHNAATAGLDISGFLGLQISNFLGLGLSNAALSIGNAGLNLGFTGLDLTMSGIAMTNNGMYLINGGGPAEAGAAASIGGPGAAVVAVAGALGLVAAGSGLAAAISAGSDAWKDVQKLLKDPMLTPAVQARLRNALYSPWSLNTTSTDGLEAQNRGEVDAQLQKLANEMPNPDATDDNGLPKTIPRPQPADDPMPNVEPPSTPNSPLPAPPAPAAP
jgi:type VI secretion system secreted protein VgrG